jgi:hypothetical protein
MPPIELNTYGLTKVFLQNLLKHQPNYPHAQELLDLLEAKDPKAIDLILELSDDPLFEGYATPDVLEELRHNMGIDVSTDERCLQVLNEYKAKTTDPEILRALDKSIAYLEIPDGAVVPEEAWPVDDLLEVIEKFPGEIGLLAGCAHYIANSLDDD